MKALRRNLFLIGGVLLACSLALFVLLFLTDAPVGGSPLAFFIRLFAGFIPFLSILLLIAAARIKKE